MVKNLPAQEEGHGFDPWPGKIPHAADRLSLSASRTKVVSPRAQLCHKKSHQDEKSPRGSWRGAWLTAARAKPHSSEDKRSQKRRNQRLHRASSVVAAHGPSCSAPRGTFPDQGWNPRPPHWQADTHPPCHQRRPMPACLGFLPTQVSREPRLQLPTLYGRFPLVTCLIRTVSSACTDAGQSQPCGLSRFLYFSSITTSLCWPVCSLPE